jgi:type III pantothenate kinase
MPEHTLLLDMGNSRIKWVVAVDGKFAQESYAHDSLESFRSEIQDLNAPDRVLLCSVANDEDTSALSEFCGSRWNVPVQRLHTEPFQAGIKNGYEQPESLGVDRWMSVIGAAHTHGMPVVIMDLGTATTLDAVDENGEHVGGLILPGPASMRKVLKTETEMRTSGDHAADDIGRGTEKGPGVGPAVSTREGISEGIYAAQLGALNQFMRHVGAQPGTEPALVLTGGAADEIRSRLDFEYEFDPWLVFKGMLIVSR